MAAIEFQVILLYTEKIDPLELAGRFYDMVLVTNQSETFIDHFQHWQKEDSDKNFSKIVILGSLCLPPQ